MYQGAYTSFRITILLAHNRRRPIPPDVGCPWFRTTPELEASALIGIGLCTRSINNGIILQIKTHHHSFTIVITLTCNHPNQGNQGRE